MRQALTVTLLLPKTAVYPPRTTKMQSRRVLIASTLRALTFGAATLAARPTESAIVDRRRKKKKKHPVWLVGNYEVEYEAVGAIFGAGSKGTESFRIVWEEVVLRKVDEDAEFALYELDVDQTLTTPTIEGERQGTWTSDGDCVHSQTMKHLSIRMNEPDLPVFRLDKGPTDATIVTSFVVNVELAESNCYGYSTWEDTTSAGFLHGEGLQVQVKPKRVEMSGTTETTNVPGVIVSDTVFASFRAGRF